LINTNLHKTSGRPRTWALRGQIRTPDGLQIADLLEEATLRPLDQPGQQAFSGTIRSNGSFAFPSLPAAAYSLSLLLPEEEIVIRRIVVGDPDD
jgi:hypothetical protein